MVRVIQLPNGHSSLMAEVEFTSASATGMLPLVRKIVADLLRLNDAIAAGRDQVAVIEQLADTIDRSEYRDELNDISVSLAADEKHFDACLRELTALGVVPHAPFDGSLDFPAFYQRRRVSLCWCPGEEQVAHWHEPGLHSKDRQPLEADGI